MQKSMLKFILRDSLSLARAVTKTTGLEMLSGNIKQNVAIVRFRKVLRMHKKP